jgi:hypothetical protein
VIPGVNLGLNDLRPEHNPDLRAVFVSGFQGRKEEGRDDSFVLLMCVQVDNLSHQYGVMAQIRRERAQIASNKKMLVV